MWCIASRVKKTPLVSPKKKKTPQTEVLYCHVSLGNIKKINI